jgi:hypothetical protein
LDPLSCGRPLSTQTPVPVAQESVPLWHTLEEGVQGPPLLQTSHTPALVQTLPGSHSAPGALLPLATHTCEPVAQEYVPVLQVSVG